MKTNQSIKGVVPSSDQSTHGFWHGINLHFKSLNLIIIYQWAVTINPNQAQHNKLQQRRNSVQFFWTTRETRFFGFSVFDAVALIKLPAWGSLLDVVAMSTVSDTFVFYLISSKELLERLPWRWPSWYATQRQVAGLHLINSTTPSSSSAHLIQYSYFSGVR